MTGQKNMVAVIMAGGVGTRFWPLSTDERPKQFLKLIDNRSLLQMSYDRVSPLFPPERILVLTNAAHVDLARTQLPQIPAENIIGEPMRRDTAAAVCLGALLAQKLYDNPVIVTLTADHLIKPLELFQKCILSAVSQAERERQLITFAIKPTYPATAYGYLECGEQTYVDDGIEHLKVLSFKEKPEAATAADYLRSGKFYWNSGMFVWSASTILEELRVNLPDHLDKLTRAVEKFKTPGWPAALEQAFIPLKKISIDYAVMEKAGEIRGVVSKFDWMDLGGWKALENFMPLDQEKNRIHGQVHTMDARNNLVYAEDPEETILLAGVNDLVVVRSGKRTLVIHRDQIEEVKKMVEKLTTL